MISVIVCSVDANKFAAVSASYARAMGGHAYELIGIHDAPSLCEGYNRGLQRANGDFVVFSHDDIELPAIGIGDCIDRHFRSFDVFGIAGTSSLAGMGWAHSGLAHAHGVITHVKNNTLDVQLFGVTAMEMGDIQALDGVWIAATADVARRVGFDEETFDGWHGYDTDFSFRCHLSGFRVGVIADVPLVHASTGKVDAAWLHFARRFREKHSASIQGTYGRWLDVLMRVGSTDEILAAYDIDTLRLQTKFVRNRLETA